MNKRPPFIVIEGLDRSGKTTQTMALCERLKEQGINAVLLKFPDRTTAIGQMIDSYLNSQSELDDHAIHLLFSANRWELASTLRTHLAAGTLVLCDRYAFSGVAFSASKPGLIYEWCRAPDIGLPAPDLTIFFDISPEQARLRGGYGAERYEKEEMQARVRKVFEVIGAEPDIRERWVKLDAGKEMGEVTKEVWNAVEEMVTMGVEGPVEALWVQGMQ